ncbi:hypothetical protein [Streptacidiphilus sp. MAP12-16]|uniref:hypothetical protein n=1 Tax=Streptacidiphilus sp. MAP12-16 TaxID=3156300 RepID=UPI003512125D
MPWLTPILALSERVGHAAGPAGAADAGIDTAEEGLDAEGEANGGIDTGADAAALTDAPAPVALGVGDGFEAAHPVASAATHISDAAANPLRPGIPADDVIVSCPSAE